jgi:hypothetical protein
VAPLVGVGAVQQDDLLTRLADRDQVEVDVPGVAFVHPVLDGVEPVAQ